jgi:hypothetical protein
MVAALGDLLEDGRVKLYWSTRSVISRGPTATSRWRSVPDGRANFALKRADLSRGPSDANCTCGDTTSRTIGRGGTPN